MRTPQVFRSILLVMLITLFVAWHSNCSYAFVKAMWVTRYQLGSAESIDKFVKTAKENGFNTLFVQVCGRGIAYYNSSILPRKDEDFDALAYTVEKSHSAGIKLHAWINAYYVWSSIEAPEETDHVVNLRPDWLLEPGTMLFLNPSIKGVREHLRDVYVEVAEKYAIDGIHFDYIRYPGWNSGFDYESRRKFFNSFGVDPQYLATDPKILRDYYGREGFQKLRSKWVQYRCSNVTELVSSVRSGIDGLKKSIKISAAVYPDIEEARAEKGQDWLLWLKNGFVDFVVPMIYTSDMDRLKDMVLLDAALSRKKDTVLPGLGAFKMGADDLIKQIKLVRHYKKYYGSIAGVSLFSYDSASVDPVYLLKLKKHAF